MKALKLFSNEQVRNWDQYTIQANAESSLDLMERVAVAATEFIVNKFPNQNEFVVFCGCGNNGGDGLAISRLLAEQGKKVTTFTVMHTDKQSNDFIENEKRLQSRNAVKLFEIFNANDFPKLIGNEFIIDALFGTGLSKQICGIAAEAINFMNASEQTVISIDLPSGLKSDESSLENAHIVKANYTVSFQVPKLAFLFPENSQFTGKWFLVDIGLSNAYYEETETLNYILDPYFIQSLIKKRDKFAHKGNFGHALLVAGSMGKIGAAVLSASAAVRSGVGLISIQTPSCGREIIQSCIPEAMHIADENTNTISNIENIEQFDVLGIGPGIGTEASSIKALESLLNRSNCPMVIDADALNGLSINKSLLPLLQENAILTPHVKEFERLVGQSKNDFERHQMQLNFSIKHKVIIVLKGANTCITSPDGLSYFNNNGNPGMAKGGSGDVLTGLMTGILAQGYHPLNAALLAVYIHGRAGDYAANKYSQSAMIASDIVNCFSDVFKELENETTR
jgi:NAD(P)H-hydrate epimerase